MAIGPSHQSFIIKHAGRDAGHAANYNYEIFQSDKIVARYWHDFRGDAHGIIFNDGKKESWPVGKMTEFLKGGGPQPLELSAAAIKFLREKLPIS